MPKHYKYSSLIIFILFVQCVIAQQFKFDVINHEKGLYSSRINKLYKDSRGLLWIGGDGAGLFSYNGYEFKNYNKVSDYENLFVVDIIENQKKQLVLSSRYLGILFFEGNKFIKVTKLFDDKNVQQSDVSKLAKTKKGIFGFSVSSVYFIDNNNKVSWVKGLKDYSISNITSAETINEELILLGTDKGLLVYNVKKNIIEKISNFKDEVTICKGINASVLVADISGNVFETTFKNTKLDQNKLLVTIQSKNGGVFKITNILQNLNGNIWFTGTKETGIGIIYDKNNYTILDSKNIIEKSKCDFSKSKCVFFLTNIVKTLNDV